MNNVQHVININLLILVNQFLRGLIEENSIEYERIGIERDIEELVNLLEHVEKERTNCAAARRSLQNHQARYQAYTIAVSYYKNRLS
ncbi:hypothetical protein RirG_053550 [Rhizophagus irregularis DAOM 197198w]|uniref:Uncharacterized protein n=1 Tax=Rhizophagus irregularis (strain DAOM 197198w) TaxID=1432141 RepID=A0A015K3M1_RHIIW|nr:hypothetical protein RirG_053550 [Rhizophagus irregularis DAOM 197198w]